MKTRVLIRGFIGFSEFLNYLKKRAPPLMILSRKYIAGEAQVGRCLSIARVLFLRYRYQGLKRISCFNPSTHPFTRQTCHYWCTYFFDPVIAT